MKHQNQQQIALQPFLLVICCLAGLGLVMVASSSMAIAHAQFQAPFYYVIRQAIFLLMGTVLAVVITRVPIHFWEKISRPLLLLAGVMLALLFVPGLGREVNGSLRWIRVGPIGLQVSELAKLCLMIYLAAYCSEHEHILRTRPWAFIKPLIPVGLMCALILLQPDFGAVVVILMCSMGVLFLVGTPLWSFAFTVALGMIAMAGLAMSEPYRLARLTAFLNPWADQYDSGYQLTQALIAFGRGDWFGMGLGSGVQKLLYLPEAHTDFIYAVIAEELGLVGALVVLLLYALLAFLGFKVGKQAYQRGQSFAAYLAYGLSLWLGLQAFIAMAVNMGLLPTKGLTLPLISSGGSSLMITLVAVSLLVRVHIELKSE